MNICVVGWYMTPELYSLLRQVNERFPVHIVSHKPDSETFLQSTELNYTLKQNIGLEFGAYDYYIKNIWTGGNVLFMHDDTHIANPSVFDEITKLPCDQAYLFKDELEETANAGQHGRGIYMSERLIRFMLSYTCRCHHTTQRIDPHHGNRLLPANPPHSGFFYDQFNTGHTSGSPPEGVCHYNDMIYHFHRYMGWIRDGKLGNEKMSVVNRVHFNDFQAGRRGVWRS